MYHCNHYHGVGCPRLATVKPCGSSQKCHPRHAFPRESGRRESKQIQPEKATQRFMVCIHILRLVFG